MKSSLRKPKYSKNMDDDYTTRQQKSKYSRDMDDGYIKQFDQSLSLNTNTNNNNTNNSNKRNDTTTTLVLPKAGTEDYVNKIVLKPMTQEQIKFKLDWYNTMTQRTVTCTKVRGKQSQACWVCGYSSWCRNLEYNFSCFENGIYLKWCCDCMAAEMGGKFMPSHELKQARSSQGTPRSTAAVISKPPQLKQQEQPPPPPPQQVTPEYRPARLKLRLEEEEEEPPVLPGRPIHDGSSSSSLSKYSSGNTSDESTAVMSPMSSSTSSSTVLGSEEMMGHFLCTNCSCLLEELRTSFSDEEAVGFQCTECRNDEYYCLLCAHENGGRFCNASTCGSFFCGNCQPQEQHDDYFYCTKACEPRRTNKRLYARDQVGEI